MSNGGFEEYELKDIMRILTWNYQNTNMLKVLQLLHL